MRASMLNSSLRTLAIIIASSAPAFAGNGYMYPDGSMVMQNGDGSYSYGYVYQDGAVNVQNPGGTFSYGNMSPDGSMGIQNPQGEYSYGQVDR